jgi:two-component system response regulator HydG
MFSEKNGKSFKGFTPQAMDRLIKYHWPGNVREMMNTIESAVVLSGSEYLSESDFSLLPDGTHHAAPGDQPVPNLPLEEVEKSTILKTLETSGGNKSEASRRLGITRATLHKKLKKYGM